MQKLTPIHKSPANWLIIAAFAAVYIIWGSTYLAILVAVKSIPPFLLAATRFIIAGTILYVWCRFKGQPTPNIKSIGHISVSGILLLFLGNCSLVWAEQYLPSGLAAIIIASVPLWFVLLDKHQWKYHFANKQILGGLLLGFAGVLSLFAGKSDFDFQHNTMQLVSFFVLLFGSISWATGSLYSKYVTTEGSAGMKAAIQMIAAGLLSGIISISIGEVHHLLWRTITLDSLKALFYLVTFGSLVGYMAYVWLLSVKPPSLVGTYAYVNPIVAIFLGSYYLHEKITPHQIFALVIILIGVIIVNLSKEKLIHI